MLDTNIKKWNIPKLLLFHAIVIALIATFVWPFTRTYWDIVDHTFFKWINKTLEGSPLRQLFWACANHKWADWIEDLCILAFFIFFVRSLPKGIRRQGVAQILFSILYCAAVLFFVNRIVFREHLIIYRDSPTLVIENTVRLSQEIPWMRIKDDSNKCFPGDHATTALLFAGCYAFLAKRKLALWGGIYALFLCMPRMIAGAHWLSDVIVGSGSIVLLFLSWAFFTPLASWGTDKLLKFFTFFRKFKRITS